MISGSPQTLARLNDRPSTGMNPIVHRVPSAIGTSARTASRGRRSMTTASTATSAAAYRVPCQYAASTSRLAS